MTPALIVDGLIVVAVLIALLSGWRNGALAAVLASIGVGAGVVLGIAVAPAALRLVEQPSLRLLLLVGILVLFVGVGQLIGSSLGGSVRDRMKARKTQRLDSAVGAVFQAFAALVVIWLISIPVATNLGGAAGQGLRDSRILGKLNSAAPAQVASLPNGVAAMLNESGLPPLVSPWQNSISTEEVEEPDPDVQDPELVRRMRPSIIHVLGDAEECSRRLMGSGFVAADDYVITNAHVVAGTQTVRLDTKVGLKDATVVYYNPDVDSEGMRHIVLLVGTPAIWWPCVPVLLWGLWCWFIHRDGRWTIPLVGFAAGFLPWLPVMDRQMYLFYAVNLSPFLIIALALALGQISTWQITQPGQVPSQYKAVNWWKNDTGRIVVVAYTAFCVWNFLFFLPMYTGMPLTALEWCSRIWLPSWA